jgi:4-amino-4-deoxy-L-arabinose transferase-like glycosyltransferase
LKENPRLAWIVAVLWVLGLVGITTWLHLGGIGLVDETEPLFAEAARQMTVTGDWITPYFNDKPRFDKPPLVYWLMALAYETVGVNEWSVRFPSALALTVLAGMSFYTLYRFGFPRPIEQPQTESESVLSSSPSPPFSRSSPLLCLWLSALIGSAAIVLNPQTLLWSRTGVSDMLLSGCMGVALLAFFCGYAQPEKPGIQAWWYGGFYGFSALAVLTKGPVAIVLPGGIILMFLLYVGQLRSVLREMHWLWGTVGFLLITIPWYVLVILSNGEAFIDSFFGYHNVERFTRVVNNHWAPWFFYFVVVPLSFLPWSMHLPVAMARLRFWRLSDWRRQPRSTHLGLFALVWFVVIFGFFTIAVTKLPSYTLPLLPAAGILVGLFWSEQMTRRHTTLTAWISHGLNLAVFAGLAIVAPFIPHWLGNDPEMPNLTVVMQQAGIFPWTAAIWAVATTTGLLLLWRRQGRWLWSLNGLSFLATIVITLIPAAVIVDSQRQFPLRHLAETIIQVQQPHEPIVMIGFSKPSLVFYTQKPVIYLKEVDEVAQDLRQLARRYPEAKSLLLLGRSLKLKEAELSPQKYQSIDQAGVYQLVRIKTSDARDGLKARD